MEENFFTFLPYKEMSFKIIKIFKQYPIMDSLMRSSNSCGERYSGWQGIYPLQGRYPFPVY